MRPKSKPTDLSKWIRRRFPGDYDAMLLLAENFIEENKVNWESPESKKSLEEYLGGFSHKPNTKTDSFVDGYRKHSAVYQPFEVNDKDVDIRTPPLIFPAEVKELLKELEDKAYKSPLLANLDSLGRCKLTRKAKVLAFLNGKKII